MKNKRGSIVLYVLFSCLFLIMFLSIILMYSSIKKQTESEATKHVESIYSSKSSDEVYESFIGEGAIPIYTFEQLQKMCSGEQIFIKEERKILYFFY